MRRYGWQGWALFAMRVGMGLFFLNEAFTQLRKGWLGGDGLERFLQARIDNGSVPGFYEWFLTDVVIANDQLFTAIVLLGEVGMGVALVLGLLTCVTSLNGIFMNTNFLVMNDKNIGAAGVDALFVVGQIVLLVFAARQALSLDEKVIERGVALPLVRNACMQSTRLLKKEEALGVRRVQRPAHAPARDPSVRHQPSGRRCNG